MVERFLGDLVVELLGLPKIPVLFGAVVILKKPLLIPGTLIYMLVVYVLPVGIIARLSGPLLNRLITWLLNLSPIFSVVITPS
jgi:branched-chain amino acid transport system permease protein